MIGPMADPPVDESRRPDSDQPPSEPWYDRIARRPYVAGLPEWDLFPTEADRLRALRTIERGMTPRSLLDILRFGAVVGVLFLVPWWLCSTLADLLFPGDPRRGWFTLVTATLAYITLVFVLIRRSIPRDIRRELLACGVPICVRCGYGLRGIAADRNCCPECGRRFSPEVRTVLAAAPTEDLGDESRD